MTRRNPVRRRKRMVPSTTKDDDIRTSQSNASLSGAGPEAPALSLQSSAGNAAMARLIHRQEAYPETEEDMALEQEPPEQETEEFEPDVGGPLPQGFVAGGRVGTVPVGGSDVNIAGVPHSFELAKRVTGAEAAGPEPGRPTDGGLASQHGQDPSGPADDTDVPRAFINVGKSGNVTWVGGGGAGPHGNQSVGSMQMHIPPVYSSRSNGLFEESEAWVAPWSARVLVLRSWVGSNAGDQGNGWFVTPAAAARLDVHEALHASNTQGHYDSFLGPVQNRAHSTQAWAYRQAAARESVRSIVDWEAAISSFQLNDRADNRPGGSVDTNDVGSGTYVVNAGPGTVGGTAFTNRLKTPGEPAPG